MAERQGTAKLQDSKYGAVLLRFVGKFPENANERFAYELNPLMRHFGNAVVRSAVAEDDPLVYYAHQARPYPWDDPGTYAMLPAVWILPTALASTVDERLWTADGKARENTQHERWGPLGLSWRFEPFEPDGYGTVYVRRTLSRDSSFDGICTTALVREFPNGFKLVMGSIVDRESNFSQRTFHSYSSYGEKAETVIEAPRSLTGQEARMLGDKVEERTYNYQRAMQAMGLPKPELKVVHDTKVRNDDG